MQTETTQELKIITPDAVALNKSANSTLIIMRNFTIDSQMMYEQAGSELKGIKGKQKELDEKRKAITKPLDEAKKSVMSLFEEPLRILNEAEAVLKKSMIAYSNEQENLRRIEQAKLDEAARIEAARLAAEGAQREAQAKAAAESGNAEEAERISSEAAALQATSLMTTAPVAAKTLAKVGGISTRTTWKAEVTDLLELVKYVAANPHMIDLLQPNMTAINQIAKATKDNTKIDGVRVYSEQGLASRAS